MYQNHNLNRTILMRMWIAETLCSNNIMLFYLLLSFFQRLRNILTIAMHK